MIAARTTLALLTECRLEFAPTSGLPLCSQNSLPSHLEEAVMSDNAHIESPAFRQAQLQSERLRLLIVLGTIGIGFLLRSVRVLIHSGDENVQLWLTTLGVLAPFAGGRIPDVARR